MREDVAGLVERLTAHPWDHDEDALVGAAILLITRQDALARAQAAEIERLRKLIRDNGTPRFNEACRRAEAAEAKLREAVEVMERAAVRFELLACDDDDTRNGVVPSVGATEIRAFLAMEKTDD